MKHRNVGLLLIMLVCAVALAVGLGMTEINNVIPFWAEISTNGNVERIVCWEDNNGDAYVFLPGFANLSETEIRMNTESVVYLDEVQITDGMYCDGFELNVPYQLTYSAWGKDYHRQISFVQSSGVSTMYIDTQSGSMDYIHAEKGNEESGEIRLYAADGALEYDGALESINGRGNYSWDAFEKKPYSIKLSVEADLLDMGRAQKWILLANASDTSNMRNKIVYDFAKELGLEYSPDSQWVDLYLNGEYAGLYLLCERNEVHSERVDIAHDESVLVSLEVERRLWNQGYTYISTDAGQSLRVHYPRDITAQGLAETRKIWQSVENAILAGEGIDANTNRILAELMDIDSWAKKYLIDEVFGNLDAGLASHYLYYNALTDRVYAGPVWDFDHAIGNDYDPVWSIANSDVLIVTRAFTDELWYTSLLSKEIFYNRVVHIYEEEFLPLLQRFIPNDLEIYANQILKAAEADGVRWKQYGEKRALLPQVDQIRSYLEEHSNYLSEIWLQDVKYCQIAFRNTMGNNLYFSVRSGESFCKELNLEDMENAAFLGWYYEGTDEPFDPEKSITEDIAVYAKWEKKGQVDEKLGQIGKLLPIGILGCVMIVIFAADIRRMKRGE